MIELETYFEAMDRKRRDRAWLRSAVLGFALACGLAAVMLWWIGP